MKTLIQWIIEQIGGRDSLITQAKAIEKDPILRADGKIVFD